MTEQRPSRQGCWVYFGIWLGASGAELLGLGDKRVSAQIELITPRWVDWLVGWVFSWYLPPFRHHSKNGGDPNQAS